MFFSHLWGEHVSDAVHCSFQKQTSYQETEKHHVREERAEVHHLRERQRPKREREKVKYIKRCCHGHAFLKPHTRRTTKMQIHAHMQTRTHNKSITKLLFVCFALNL